jgi:hypothetical protein
MFRTILVHLQEQFCKLYIAFSTCRYICLLCGYSQTTDRPIRHLDFERPKKVHFESIKVCHALAHGRLLNVRFVIARTWLFNGLCCSKLAFFNLSVTAPCLAMISPEFLWTKVNLSEKRHFLLTYEI